MTKSYAETLVEAFCKLGITDVFLVTGGAIAPFTSALASDNRINMHYFITEGGAAAACEAYGFTCGRPGLLVVTSGPGVTNALTATAAAFTNSSPMIVVSGQARIQDVLQSEKIDSRQIGNQHLRTNEIVKSITKFFIECIEPIHSENLTNFLYQKALNGRQGPVWLSLPQDLQRRKNFEFEDFNHKYEMRYYDLTPLSKLLEKLVRSESPLILIGNGARPISREIIDFSQKFRIPVQTTWPGMDLIHDSAQLFSGRPGAIASSMAANLVLENCTNLLIVGARLDLNQVGFAPESFAKNAEVTRVDIDEAELQRIPQRDTWHNLISDSAALKDFLDVQIEYNLEKRDLWLQRISDWKSLPRAGEMDQNLDDGISTYKVLQTLNAMKLPDVIASGSSGTCMEMFLQSWQVVENQRIINSCGLGSMGFGIPGAIGTHLATKKEVLCLESDGSFWMSAVENSLIARNSFPIKTVILDSDGYKSISLSQKRLGQVSHGSLNENGLSLLDIENFLESIGIESRTILTTTELPDAFHWMLESKNPRTVICKVSKKEEALPRLINKINSSGEIITPSFSELTVEI